MIPQVIYEGAYLPKEDSSKLLQLIYEGDSQARNLLADLLEDNGFSDQAASLRKNGYIFELPSYYEDGLDEKSCSVYWVVGIKGKRSYRNVFLGKKYTKG